MEFFKKNNKYGFVVVKRAAPSELRFDEKTATVRIIIGKDSPEVRVVSASPVIMPRKVRRDIKKADIEKSDERKFSKLTVCGV